MAALCQLVVWGQASEMAQKVYQVKHTAGLVNWPLIIGCFIFYFFGGYLFYASLFAAVGSVTEDIQNSQGLTLPVTMPIIFSFIAMSIVVYYARYQSCKVDQHHTI